MKQVIQYRTQGTCCQLMQLEIEDNIIKNVDFYGGCNGNLKAIKSLVAGMHIEDVIGKLSGIRCGDKPTSCPDQLAQCLIAYSKEVSLNKTNKIS